MIKVSKSIIFIAIFILMMFKSIAGEDVCVDGTPLSTEEETYCGEFVRYPILKTIFDDYETYDA